MIRAADDDDYNLATNTRTRKKKDTDDAVKVAKRECLLLHSTIRILTVGPRFQRTARSRLVPEMSPSHLATSSMVLSERERAARGVGADHSGSLGSQNRPVRRQDRQ